MDFIKLIKIKQIIKMLNLKKNIYKSNTKQKIINLIKFIMSINKHKVYGRVACLGRNIFELRYPKDTKTLLVNQQKVRVDLFVEWLEGAAKPRAELVKKYMLRQDVYPLIEQQSVSNWNSKCNFLYFLIDSFSELSDQKFTHKDEGWSFCCHYTDINHDSDFDNIFECNGLLPINKIESSYDKFFNFIEEYYPNKKVFFIHFPTKYDERPIFKERGEEILRVMNKFQQERKNIQNVYINEELVELNENDYFPYHFSSQTNNAFLAQWLKII
jgi:hypothetical protein